MKTAVIYYSYEGNCALIAEILKTALSADVYEIKTLDEKKRTGFFLYLWGGSQAIFGKKPAIHPVPADLNAYDLIILGCPVWAGSPAPAIASFLDGGKISGKKLALFCCHGGGMGKALEKLKALLPGNTIISEADFKYPARGDKAALKLKIEEWVKTLNLAHNLTK